MARKRMISPEIWESDGFSKLSDLAKLVFIGLFSHADDEGYGKAKPGYIRSKLFPNDDDRRITDIRDALSEIAREMSIIFYEVGGDRFYHLTNWTIWQKVDRPSPSRIPKPPATLGVRGSITQNSEFGNESGNALGTFVEDSSIKEKRIEQKGIEQKGIEERKAQLLRELFSPSLILDESILLSDKEYIQLSAVYQKNDWLKKNYLHLSKIHKWKNRILTKYYDKFDSSEPKQTILTHDESDMNAEFDNVNARLLE